MRFLHTADLHIGKRLFETSLSEDQREILRQIAEIAVNEHCDAVLIAGDIYDRPTPSAEAMSIFDTFVSALVLGGVSVYAISGNHDSGERVSYLSGLIEERGVFIQGRYEGRLCRRVLRDQYGEMDLYLLPFLKPLTVRGFFPDSEIVTYEDALREVLREVDFGDGRRKVLMSHQFVTGAATCDSEEFAIGGLDCISDTVFEGFDYVALGHIHGPQRIKRDTMRYSGTPLKYSFSEVSHKKSVTIVDIGAKGEVDCRQVLLKPLRDMRVLEGSVADLLEMPYSEDYVHIIVTDEEVAPDTRLQLAPAFPNMLKFSVKNSRTGMAWEASGGEELLERKTPLDMMEDFYREQNNGVPMNSEKRALLSRLLESVEGEESL